MQPFLAGTATPTLSALEKGIKNVTRGFFELFSYNDISTAWNTYLTGDIQQGVVDLLGTVVSIVDPDPQNGAAIWEVDLGDGSSEVSILLTEQTFIADGAAVGDLVKVEALIVDDTFVAVDLILQNQDADNEKYNANQNEIGNEKQRLPSYSAYLVAERFTAPDSAVDGWTQSAL